MAFSGLISLLPSWDLGIEFKSGFMINAFTIEPDKKL